jgi:DNA invertase Pin-like site-specific DNA recombinase
LVVLSDADSNNYEAALLFKQSLPTPQNALSVSPDPIISPSGRTINQYGEAEACRPKQEQKRLNAEETQMLIAEYQQGKSVYALAEQFSCHRVTVSDILKRNDIKVSKSKWRDALDISDVVTMYNAMHTTQEIAEKYGMSSQIIICCLRENGVQIRSRWDY